MVEPASDLSPRAPLLHYGSLVNGI